MPEIDIVGYEGGDSHGEFAQTLTVTDVFTGWTETQAVWNKAQKNWSVVRRAVGYHRYDTPPELELLNRIYELLRLQTNFFSPQQKLAEKHRECAKMTKRYDTATTLIWGSWPTSRSPRSARPNFADSTSSSTRHRSAATS